MRKIGRQLLNRPIEPGQGLVVLAVRSLALTSDGRRLYALSLDGTKVWAIDAMTGQPLATLPVSDATRVARVH